MALFDENPIVVSLKANHACFIAMVLSCALAAYGQTQPPENADVGTRAVEPVFKVGGGVTPPRPKYMPDPEYSDEARAAGFQGTCVLQVIVGSDGNVRDIKVTRPLGKGLDEKAIEAVRTWRFEPARKDGNAVAAQINVEISFRTDRNSNSNENTKISKLTKKADAGDPRAELELARDYLEGQDVPKNEALGLQLLKRAANRGLAQAQFLMGKHAYAHASGSADYVDAYMWYELARRGGYKHGDKMLRQVASKMSPEQLLEAKTRVDNWSGAPVK